MIPKPSCSRSPSGGAASAAERAARPRTQVTEGVGSACGRHHQSTVRRSAARRFADQRGAHSYVESEMISRDRDLAQLFIGVGSPIVWTAFLLISISLWS